MKRNRLCELLGIEHPVIQASMPWVANAELAAAVSEAGGLGVVSPTAAMARDGDMRENLRHQIRLARSLTQQPVAVGLYLGYPQVGELARIVVEEGVRIVITYGGSPALYTGFLKENDILVMHLVASVRHARAAEAQGVDVVVAEGFEGGGFRGVTEVSTFVLTPQIVEAVDIPVVASGGIADGRGMAAALCAGAMGVYVGTRFVATKECAAHPRFKEALIKAVDTDTLIAYHDRIPIRLLRNEASLRLRRPASQDPNALPWSEEMQRERVRAALLEGEVKEGIAYCGAGVGLINEVMPAAEVVRSLVEGSKHILSRVSATL